MNFAVFDTDAWIHRSMCSSYANFSYIKDDAVLQGSVYWTFRNKTQEECEAECVNEFHCRSVNTEKDGDRMCELNMENVLEKIKNLQLTPKIGWVHKATDYNDPWVKFHASSFFLCLDNINSENSYLMSFRKI